MKADQIDEILRATLDDVKLSRSERRALTEVFDEQQLTDQDRQFWRHRAFAIARDAITYADDRQILGWLEDVVKVLAPAPAKDAAEMQIYFSPGDQCRRAIAGLFDRATRTVDICVFTITDNRLTEHILRAHQRGIALRVITDDEKAWDKGSDIDTLRRAGIALKVDNSEAHMHHKYAIFDRHTVVTGSYNWTRSASEYNRENVVIAPDPRMVARFQANFDGMWKDFGAPD